MCSSFSDLFTVTGNNNIMYSKNRIGHRKFYSKLSITVFQITSVRLTSSKSEKENFSCPLSVVVILRLANTAFQQHQKYFPRIFSN